MKTYTIKNRQFTQNELTLEQDEKISDLLELVQINDLKDFGDLSLAQIAQVLFKKKVLVKLLSIVLIPADGGVALSEKETAKITNTLAMEIIEDFFTLNASLMSVLKSLLSGLAGTSMSPKSSIGAQSKPKKTSGSIEKRKG